MLFVDFAKSMRISTSVETFAEHLEAYAGVPTLLIKTDDNTVRHLEGKFALKASEEEKTSSEPKEVKPEVEEGKPVVEENPTDESEDKTTDNHE